MVSGNYFSLFDVKPALGRAFLPEEDRAVGKAPVAVISYDLWKRDFNGDPTAIGSSIKLNNRVYTIIGVAARSFTGFDLSYRPEIFVPMKTDAVSCSGDTCTVVVTIFSVFNPGSGATIAGGLTAWIPSEQRSAYLSGQTPSGEQAYRVQITYKRRGEEWRAVEFDRAPAK